MPLPEGYYLLDFETILGTVRATYGDLLHDEERRTLEIFLELPLDARRLCVRLLIRKGPWFRGDRIAYRELRDPEEALERLCAAGFCESGGRAEDLLSLLVREELAQCLEAFGLPPGRGLRRTMLEERLLAFPDRAALEAHLRLLLRPVRLLHGELWALLCFLFFGNGAQDLSSFVLADLGRVRYEAYPLDPAHRLFQCRGDVDFLLSIRALRSAFERASAREEPEALEALTATVLSMEPHPGVRQQRSCHRLLNDLGRHWERWGEPARARDCYARSALPPARERLVRLQADPVQACAMALTLAEAPWDVGEERFARRFLERHRRRVPEADRWLREHPAPPGLPEISLVLPRRAPVEQAALDAARGMGWEGFLAENTLWNALFGLVFWEELFAPVPGAFQHRFQSAPLDIGHPDFFHRRRESIERRLAEIQDPEALRRRVLGTAEAKWGIANAFLAWRRLDRKLLEAAACRMPPGVLAPVLRTVARNPRAYAHGFPDLFLFRPGRPDWALWEVKGPGDALRPEQARWLERFRELGCEAKVARVAWEPT